MERLESQQDQLSLWLSADTDHILDECGEILRFSEYKTIMTQPSGEQKMSRLLKTILCKGSETCETFVEILRKNRERYPPLQQFFSGASDGSAAPTVFADNNSVVTHTTLSDIKGKTLTYKVETESSPRGHPPGNCVPAANYTATGGSVIIADRISGASFKGINFSVSIKQSQVPSAAGGPVDVPSQDPAGKMILVHKVKLTEWLMTDPDYILQHVHQKSLVTHREYQNLKSSCQPEETVTKLLDKVISKGPEKCAQFLRLLRKPEVLQTFPQLRDILDDDA